MESRSIWLVLKDGRPHYCEWASVKTYAEGEALASAPGAKNSPSWFAALDADEAEEDGFSATPTKWRRVPYLFFPMWLRDDPDTPVTVDGRAITVAGVTYSLDTEGDSVGAGKEPDIPDASSVDEDIVLAQAERKGVVIKFRDSAKKTWLVSNVADEVPSEDADVKIYRNSGTKTRVDA